MPGSYRHWRRLKYACKSLPCVAVMSSADHTRSHAKLARHVTIRALGYRDDMFELMQIADAVVARPGTGTTSEAIMAGCPLLLNTLGGIMPQEWITVKYLRSHGIQPSDSRNQPTWQIRFKHWSRIHKNWTTQARHD